MEITRNKIYKEAQYILNHLNEIDARYYCDVTEEVYEHLLQIRFTAEEIQRQSQKYVRRFEKEGERDRP